MSLNTIRIFIALGFLPILVGVVAMLIMLNGPVLTNEEARTLVITYWGDCSYGREESAESSYQRLDCDRLDVTKKKINDTWYIEATYEGLKDDSVTAQRLTAPVDYYEDNWWLRDPVITHRCQPNRGHQDFSSELCL